MERSRLDAVGIIHDSGGEEVGLDWSGSRGGQRGTWLLDQRKAGQQDLLMEQTLMWVREQGKRPACQG